MLPVLRGKQCYQNCKGEITKGKAVQQSLTNKEKEGNTDELGFCQRLLFLFFPTSPTELLPGFLKIIVRLAWRYTFKISVFLSGTHLSYINKRNRKILGRSSYSYAYSEVYLLGGKQGMKYFFYAII